MAALCGHIFLPFVRRLTAGNVAMPPKRRKAAWAEQRSRALADDVLSIGTPYQLSSTQYLSIVTAL